MNKQPLDCRLEVETRENALIPRFANPVSLYGQVAEDAAEQLVALLSKTDRKQFLVDFGNVLSLTSYMLGQLVRLSRLAEADGRRLALFNLPPHIRQILEVARLNLLLSLYGDESAALGGS